MLEDIFKMRSLWRYAAALAVLGWCSAASAQEQSFGDWAKQCEPAGAAERCYIVQTVEADGKPVMVVVVAYSPKRDRVAAMIDVPLEMHLPSGLQIKAGEISKKIAFEQCLPTGCRAMLPMDDQIIEAMKKGGGFAIEGMDRRAQPVQMPLSTDGFEEAFGAL